MEEQRLELINEIKQIERELYLKRSQLAAELQKDDESIYKGMDSNEWKQIFSRCTEQIGQLSTGGNSVEDVAAERQR
ncbi:MAG: hypothetical protein AB1631_29330 [Acidobacteriota bacterium]